MDNGCGFGILWKGNIRLKTSPRLNNPCWHNWNCPSMKMDYQLSDLFSLLGFSKCITKLDTCQLNKINRGSWGDTMRPEWVLVSVVLPRLASEAQLSHMQTSDNRVSALSSHGLRLLLGESRAQTETLQKRKFYNLYTLAENHTPKSN